VAIDPSGYQFLLVSLIPAGEESPLSYYLCSLTTDMNLDSRNPQVPASVAQVINGANGVCVHFMFFFWLSVNFLSFLDNGYSAER
jgi:hypothetical protein